MRKIFIFICLLFSLCGMAQKRIVMEQESGVYKIPCKVNGAKMKMIFDTGASSVSISSSIAQYLYENDYITKDDILGTDSRIVNNAIINLRDIEIDSIHMQNVKATVSESLTSPLLFGMSAIQKLGKISLNGNILTIENYTNEYYTYEQIAELESKANQAYYDENFYLAAKYLKEKERLIGLTAEEYSMLCASYCVLEEFDKCIDAVKRFENNSSDESESYDAAVIYSLLGGALDKKNIYSEAISACVKSIAIYMKFEDWENVGGEYMSMGMYYSKRNERLNAINAFKNAISYHTKYLGIPDNGIKKDEDLGLIYSLLSHEYATYFSDLHNPTFISYLRKSAQCGHEDSIQTLKELGYDMEE